MATTFLLKKAAPTDAAAISRLHAASWKAAYQGQVPQQYLDTLADDFWTETFTQQLSSGQWSALLLTDGPALAACAAYGAARDKAYAQWGEIISLYTYPDYLHLGCGRQLVEAACHDLRQRGYQQAYLWVLASNSNAIGFYQHLGFQWNGDILPSTIGNMPVVDHRYCKTL